LKDDVENQVEELDLGSSMFSDLMNAAVSEIDFREIATHFIDDVYDEWLEENKEDEEETE